MVVLAEILDADRLDTAVADGLVACKRHPSEPLRLYDYTPRAQYERVWTAETMACRGLIVDDDDRVVARPFAKFFNADEHEALLGPLPWHEPFEVFDKLDGSLGILYVEPSSGLVTVATRGSFASDQALRATSLVRSRYGSLSSLPADQTWLAEIIYPQNRIVVDYRGADDVYFLAAIDHATGLDCAVPAVWPGPVVARHAGFRDGVVDDVGDGFLQTQAQGVFGLAAQVEQDGQLIDPGADAADAVHGALDLQVERQRHVFRIAASGAAADADDAQGFGDFAADRDQPVHAAAHQHLLDQGIGVEAHHLALARQQGAGARDQRPQPGGGDERHPRQIDHETLLRAREFREGVVYDLSTRGIETAAQVDARDA